MHLNKPADICTTVYCRPSGRSRSTPGSLSSLRVSQDCTTPLRILRRHENQEQVDGKSRRLQQQADKLYVRENVRVCSHCHISRVNFSCMREETFGETRGEQGVAQGRDERRQHESCSASGVWGMRTMSPPACFCVYSSFSWPPCVNAPSCKPRECCYSMTHSWGSENVSARCYALQDNSGDVERSTSGCRLAQATETLHCL